MTDVSVYKLTVTPLEKTLPKLMEKVLQGGKRAVIVSPSKERVEVLNTLLWTYTTLTFLPHGSAIDGFADQQPIWLTSEVENPNQADVIVLCDGAQASSLQGFNRCLDLVDGNDTESVREGEKRIEMYKQQGCAVSIWQQDPKGAWQKFM
jgi:DNA polymerase III subunit chi